MIVNLGVIAILYFGGLQVNAGELTQGEVIALINYMFQILTELVKLANLIILLSRAFASLGRVNAIFEVPSFLEEGNKRQWDLNPSKDVPAISFDHVSFQYAKSGKEVLQDISFQVQQKRLESLGQPVPENQHWLNSCVAFMIIQKERFICLEKKLRRFRLFLFVNILDLSNKRQPYFPEH